ncbi:hypothetical protein [Kordia sp.]|uniref:hypothetical protein n=1 Tax=Kordia sp. TaxID=1965332 RepID=UPI003D6BC38B
MKKKKLKALSLKKASISKLNGGAQAPTPIPLSRYIRDCVFTFNQTQCTTTWVSELYTACNCPTSWEINCETSIGIPCEA